MQIKTLVFFDTLTILPLMQRDQIENDHDAFNSGGWEDIATICHCEVKELSERVDDQRTHHQVADRRLGAFLNKRVMVVLCAFKGHLTKNLDF